MFEFLWFRCIGVVSLCWVCWDLLLLVTFSACCLGDLGMGYVVGFGVMFRFVWFGLFISVLLIAGVGIVACVGAGFV